MPIDFRGRPSRNYQVALCHDHHPEYRTIGDTDPTTYLRWYGLEYTMYNFVIPQPFYRADYDALCAENVHPPDALGAISSLIQPDPPVRQHAYDSWESIGTYERASTTSAPPPPYTPLEAIEAARQTLEQMSIPPEGMLSFLDTPRYQSILEQATRLRALETERHRQSFEAYRGIPRPSVRQRHAVVQGVCANPEDPESMEEPA